MIINTSGPVRDLDAHQQAREKHTKDGDASTAAKLTAEMPDKAMSPQAQLVQRMIDAWQSKDGTLSGKVLTALENTEEKDKAVLIDMMQTLEQHEQRSVATATSGQAVEPEGVDQRGVNRMLSAAIDQLAAHEPPATRDIVTPAFVPPPEATKTVIPVHIPELQGIVSDACFEFAAMPSLVEGGFEPLPA